MQYPETDREKPNKPPSLNLIDEVLEESLELVNHSMQSHVQNKESLLGFLAVQAIWLKV